MCERESGVQCAEDQAEANTPVIQLSAKKTHTLRIESPRQQEKKDASKHGFFIQSRHRCLKPELLFVVVGRARCVGNYAIEYDEEQ